MFQILLIGIAWVPLASFIADDPLTEVRSTTTVTRDGENIKPFVVARPSGGAYLTWARRDGMRSAVFFSATEDGVNFTNPVRVSTESMDLDLGAESSPNIAVDSVGTIYVVWAAGTWSTSKGQTKPIANSGPVEKTASRSQDSGTGHGHHGSNGAPERPGKLNIYLSRSLNGGETFAAPQKINDDPDGPEHRFPTVTTDARDSIYVAWLDKRPTTTGDNACRVFVAFSNDRGQTFQPNMDATAGQANSICHCCKVGLATIAPGLVAVAYRNEIEDVRDIYLARSSNVSGPFSKPFPIEQTNWLLPACPMNGPALATDGTRVLHTLWATGGDVRGMPLVTAKSAAGYKILYRRLDSRLSALSSPVYVANGIHPRLAVSGDGAAFAAWESSGTVNVSRIAPSGAEMRAIPLSAAGAFPSLALGSNSNELFVAWHERIDDDALQIRFALITIPAATP